MSPGIGVRLADATPMILIDVVVTSLAFFLLSRVWVMVAPRLGRRLARLGLYLFPLLLVVSIAGHLGAPEVALALSDGVGFTNFVLCFLLGAVWLAALAYRFVRRRWRGLTPLRTRELTPAAEWLRLAAVMMPVAMVVALMQWDSARDEVKATGLREQALRKEVRALEAIEKKAAEFARERELLAEKLDVLHRITPQAPDVEQLMSNLQERAEPYGIQVLEWSSTPGASAERLVEQQVTLELGGDLARLESFIERTGKMARLVTWRRVTARAGQATAVLSSYSAREEETRSRRDSCVHRRSKVWLWPYTEKLRVARAQVDEVCTQRDLYAETRAQLEEFQAQQDRLQGLVTAIEKVRGEWRVPEITVDDQSEAKTPQAPRKTT